MTSPTPNFIDKVNGITRLITNPCDAPWIVYAETALPFLGEGLLVLLSFGWDDILRGYARPKGLRGPGHGRRKPGARPRRRGIPELGNLIGKMIPGQSEFAKRPVSQGIKHLWIIDGVIQRLLWWWLVIDVVSDVLYQWSTALYATEYCAMSDAGRLYAIGSGGDVLAIQGWQEVSMPNVIYAHHGVGWLGSAATLPSGRWTIISTVTTRKNTGFPSSYELGLFQAPNFTTPIARSGQITLIPGISGTCVLSETVRGPGTFAVQQRVGEGATFGQSGAVVVIQED